MKAFFNELAELRENKKKRHEMGLCLIEGKKAIVEIANKRPLVHLLTTEEHPHVKAKETFHVTQEVIEKISGNVTPDGWVATTAMPAASTLDSCRWVLALDRIQDPGNMGTLVRTALAFGFEGLFLISGGVDLFNDKVLRATKGSALFIPYREGTAQDLLSFQQKHSLSIYAGDLNGSFPEQAPSGAILILGNEGQGISPIFKDQTLPLTIPISDQVESLNVAVAGSLLMAKLKGIL